MNQEIHRNYAVSKEAVMPRKSKVEDQSSDVPAREIVEGRLYAVSFENFIPDHLDAVTVLVNMTEEVDLILPGEGIMNILWSTGDVVDERVLEGLVRLCSSAMRGIRQRVLLVGAQDAIDTISACILREYMGCSAVDALRIMREGHPECLKKTELAETVLRFRPS